MELLIWIILKWTNAKKEGEAICRAKYGQWNDIQTEDYGRWLLTADLGIM